MKVLTINQTTDLILTYLDGIKPTKAPDYLKNELNSLRRQKMAHPKGGLLPCPKSIEIKAFIQSQFSEPFNFIQNFNSASKFANNQIHYVKPSVNRALIPENCLQITTSL